MGASQEKDISKHFTKSICSEDSSLSLYSLPRDATMAKTKDPIVVPVDNKSFGWCGGLSECIRTPTVVVPRAKARLKLPKPAESSSEEDNEEEDEGLDSLNELISNFLNQAGSQEDEWSGRLALAATMFTSSSRCIDSLSSNCRTVFHKLTSTTFQDVATTTQDICVVLAKTHWAAAGLLVVAAVINNIQKLQRVDKECMELLRSMHTVGASLNRFSRLPQTPAEMESNVNRAKNLIPLGTALCLGIIQSRGYNKFFCSGRNEGKISKCRKELDRLQNDLNFQLHFADYAERHETRRSLHLGPKPNQVLPGTIADKIPGDGGSSEPAKPAEDATKKENAERRGLREDSLWKWVDPEEKYYENLFAPEDKRGIKPEANTSSATTKEEKDCRKKCKQILHECQKKFKTTYCNKALQPEGEKTTDAEPMENNVTDPVSKIKELLDLQICDKKPLAVFLWGDENTGKEELADEVCSEIKNDANVKEWLQVTVKRSEIKGSLEGLVYPNDIVPRLRIEILRKLQLEKGCAKENENDGEIESDGIWKRKLCDSLPEKKYIFIYIDYVLSAEILKKIFPKSLILNKPIRVLVTIEDKNVISALDGSLFRKKLCFMQPVSNRKAFNYLKKNLPEDEPGELSKIIKICNGYMYRVDVVGEHLFKYYSGDTDGFSIFCKWIKMKEPSFEELKHYFSCEVKFLSLPVYTRDALLDICSFFRNWEWNQTACIVGNDALKKLEESELVKRESSRVSVSNTVMSFGLSRSQGNRVTNVVDLYTSLYEVNKPGEMKGIWLLQNKVPFHIRSDKLDNMHDSLRVLALGDNTTVEGECKEQFKDLRYFQAGRVTKLPFNITKLNQPRFLENISDKDIGLPSQKVPLTLRMVKLKPQNVEDCIDMHKLLPKACKVVELDISGSKVNELPKEFCDMYALRSLILSKCIHIENLPTRFGKLRSLKMLDLSYCESLIELPSNFGWLSTLETVNLSYCRKLNDLPDSIGLLSSVKEIDLSNCKKIQKLPKSFVKLSTLRVLKLRACRHFSELPEGFEQLALEKLFLESCKRLKALPQRIENSTLVQNTASLSWCLSLPEISIGFLNMIQTHVEHLILANCTGLQALPEDFPKELSRLKTLNLSGCRSLLRLPKRLQKLQCLEKLNLSSCEKLEESSIRLSKLPLLKEVNLSNCEGLKGSCLKSLMKAKGLKFIDIHDSPNLVERWNQMKSESTVCIFTAATGQSSLGSPSFRSIRVSRNSGIAMVNKGKSPFFNDKWIFVNLNGHPFYPSALEKGTSVAVFFFRNYDKEELRVLGDILDGLQITCKRLQILHVGRSVSALPRELAIRHRVCSCDNYEAQVFFEKELLKVESFDQKISYVMMISKVVQNKEEKSFSTWTTIARYSLRDMAVDVPPIEYLRLKELIETPQEDNSKLLQTLLVTKETNFLMTSTGQEGIKDLKGKSVFLLISWLDKFEEESPTFNKVYENLKQKLQPEQAPTENIPGFEVVWIPMVDHGRGTRALFAECVKTMKWRSIGDPWSITPLAKQFLRKHYSLDKLPLFIGVSPKGQLHDENFIPDTEETEALAQFIKNWRIRA